MPRVDKMRYILFMILLYLGLYVGIQLVVTTHKFDFLTEFDKAVPFMPQHVWIYHSILPIIFATMLILVKTKKVFLTTFYACMIATLILNTSYVLFPSFYPRPDFEVNNLSEAILYMTYKIDGSNNTFPSGHVSFAWIMFFGALSSMAAKKVNGLRSLYLLWAIGISLSTLTLKQHYIVDVLSGIALAAASFYISKTIIDNRITAKH